MRPAFNSKFSLRNAPLVQVQSEAHLKLIARLAMAQCIKFFDIDFRRPYQ